MSSTLPTIAPGAASDDFVRRTDRLSDTDIVAVGDNATLVVYHRRYDSILIARHNSRSELDVELMVDNPLSVLQAIPVYAKILGMRTT